MKCLIMANGPSSKLIKQEDLYKKYDAVNSMNASYRTWLNSEFRPSHFTALDSVLTLSLADDIKQLIDEDTIGKFFLDDCFKEKYPEYENHKKILFLSDAKIKFNRTGNNGTPITTGTWAIRWMLQEKYTELDIIGMDGVRVELLNETKAVEGPDTAGILDKLIMAETPKFNPNYYSTEYQRAGDKYRIPNSDRHLKAHHIKLHDHALLSVCRDIPKIFRNATITNNSVDSTHQLIRKKSYRITPNKDKDCKLNQTDCELFEIFKENYSDLISNFDEELDSLDCFHFGGPNSYKQSTKLADNTSEYFKTSKNSTNYFNRKTIVLCFHLNMKVPIVNETEILNGIRHGAIFEWEIYTDSKQTHYYAIETLNISDQTKKRLHEYPHQIYCNFSGKASLSSAIACFRLCAKDFLLSKYFIATNPQEVENDFSRIIRQNLSITIEESDKNSSSNSLTNNLNIHRYNFINLIIKHRYTTDIHSVNIVLKFKTTPNSRFKGRIQSFTKQSNFQQNEENTFKSNENGELRCKFSMNYADKHIGCVIKIESKEKKQDNILITPVSAILLFIDDSGKSYCDSFIFCNDQPLLKNTPLNAIKYQADINTKRLILIEPDLSNKQGHFYSYANNLHRISHQNNINFVVLANEKLNVLDNDPLRDKLRPVFSKNTWTIATSTQTFFDELNKSLQEIKYNAKSDVLYMYTGSAYHALAIKDIVDVHNGRAVCTLFWEMIKDLGTESYLKVFQDLKNKLPQNDSKFRLLAPTEEIKKNIRNSLKLDITVATHPSTSVYDSEYRIQDKTKVNLRKKKKQETVLFFPGVNTIHKGYDFGIDLAIALSDLGYKCIVRRVEDIKENSKLHYLPLGLDEIEINKWFQASDLVIIPYLPEGFKNRTSGLVIDALLHCKPAAVIRNTWLEKIIVDYQAGVIIDQDTNDATKQITKFLESTEKDLAHDITAGSKKYFSRHSWAKLLSSIIST